MSFYILKIFLQALYVCYLWFMGFLLEGLREILPPHTIFHSIPPGSGDIALHRCGWEWETDQAASFPFSFLSLLSLAGRGGGWWYGYCIHMHCACWMYGIFPAYYHTLRYIYASLRMNIPYNIHLSLNAILPLFPTNVEISMLVPFFKLFL